MNALCGRWSVEARDRETGEKFRVPIGPNTVLDAGKEEFLDLMFGLGGTIFNAANTDLRLYDASDVLIKTLQCSAGPTHGAEDSGTVEYEFEDATADVYTPDRLDIFNSSSSVVFSRKDPSGIGEKPSSFNWTYVYTLSITNFGDPEIQMNGLDHALRLLTGDRSSAFINTFLELLIENSDASVTSNVAIDAGYPSRAGTTVTAIFTAEPAQANQDWNTVIVGATLVDVGWTEINRTEELLGGKSTSIEREYTFTFSV